MTIIKIAPNDNGSHDNQDYHGSLPEGWAFINNAVSIPDTFPFVNIDGMVDRDGAPYVTAMSENREAWDAAMEEQQPEEDPTDDNSSVWDELDAAYREGVDSV